MVTVVALHISYAFECGASSVTLKLDIILQIHLPVNEATSVCSTCYCCCRSHRVMLRYFLCSCLLEPHFQPASSQLSCGVWSCAAGDDDETVCPWASAHPQTESCDLREKKIAGEIQCDFSFKYDCIELFAVSHE